jgi:alkylation response protein AidB-like acyl-CoA dehydrogenase
MTQTGGTLAAVRLLQTTIQERAEEIERQRRLPDDLVASLTQAGCYRLLSPKWKSKAQAGYLDALRVIEALATFDGSVGWTVSQGALAQVILGYLPRPTLKEIYASGPDLHAAGTFAPSGRASRSNNEWRITGRWKFATGCQLASWIYLQCLVISKRRVLLGANNLPLTRLVVLPARAVAIIDTWDSMGLLGTGSHDVEIRNGHCADAWTCSLADAEADATDIQAVPLLDHAGLFAAAVAVGIGAGALDDLKAISDSGKRPTFSTHRLADDVVFHDCFGEAHMRLQAARALLFVQAELVESAIVGEVLSPLQRAKLRATPRQVTSLAAETVRVAYELARSAAVWRSSPLQRRLRDINTMTQHAWNGRDAMQNLGAVLLRPR